MKVIDHTHVACFPSACTTGQIEVALGVGIGIGFGIRTGIDWEKTSIPKSVG